ncbi:polysaccharide pyruvyl transferase family protein [Chitinibacter bivalviorum]|uniref:Polysaccharide pyruvyl transferase family protein n=1 Tax=Chitinibacter bivalviorum TaxID=2739434 RepID=A0A7H9BHV8_9NEIS|nr:polysaccharide pyruvyl transferase family protein [Chitinibacter bivalviorum]QLG88217.1 polysaccharide pyruvyl transferase family protein [Chitinibacter bivalviorum]
MSKIYFAGQDNFGNRGCEALIRANVKTILQHIPNSQFIVPSHDIKKDSAQWPDANKCGVQFVPAEPIPSAIRWWSRARRFIPALDGMPPKYKVTASTRETILSSDVLVMTGGDIISLDYGLGSLYYWMRICETAMDAGKTTVLWAGSVGPFSKMPVVEAKMRDFLRRFSLITVRETASLKYLQSLGIDHVELVVDSAFVLDFEQAPANTLQLFQQEKPVLGFNVSPLIRNFREDADAKSALDTEVVNFLLATLKQGEVNVMLVPHVDPLSGVEENSDSAYMSKILQRIRAAGFGEQHVQMLPRNLNAAQLKDVIRRCHYFMGARTHATVAALSQAVPTTSIAYSIKAKGINQDLFGHLNYVLETPKVTSESLLEHFSILTNNQAEIKSYLAEKLPDCKRNASRSAQLLKTIS